MNEYETSISNDLGDQLNWVTRDDAARIIDELIAFLQPTDRVGSISDGYHTFDELYEHRIFLFMALASTRISYSWKAKKHHDGIGYDGWFIAGTLTPAGEHISYHLPDRLWGLCPGQPMDYAPKWDGHSSADVVERLRRWLVDQKRWTEQA